MHADSLDEALDCLRGEVGAADPDLAGLTVYLQYSAYRTPSGMYRRVEEAWHLRTDVTGALAPVRLAAIDGGRSPRLTGAQRLPVPPTLAGDGGRRGRPLVHDPGAYAVLAASLGLAAADLEAELAERAAFLAGPCRSRHLRAAGGRARRGRLSDPARHRVRRSQRMTDRPRQHHPGRAARRRLPAAQRQGGDARQPAAPSCATVCRSCPASWATTRRSCPRSRTPCWPARTSSCSASAARPRAGSLARWSALLDEWVPEVAGAELHDDPLRPVSAHARAVVAEAGRRHAGGLAASRRSLRGEARHPGHHHRRPGRARWTRSRWPRDATCPTS